MMLQWCNILSWAGFSVRSRVWPQRFDPIAVTWHLQSSTASSLKATAFETTGQTSVKARIRQNSTQERITCYTACQYRPSATLPVRRHWATCLRFKARNINRNFNNPGGNGRSMLRSEYIYIFKNEWKKEVRVLTDQYTVELHWSAKWGDVRYWTSILWFWPSEWRIALQELIQLYGKATQLLLWISFHVQESQLQILCSWWCPADFAISII